MAGSFSSKKVARAARTGGGPRRGGNADYGYYAVLLVIAILGTLTVVASRNERLSAKDPGSTPPLAPSENRSGDRWYEAYGVYICDKFLPNIDNDNDPYGLSTKNDGIIYIHPFQKEYAGRNSTFGRFALAVDLKMDRDSIQLAGDPTEYKEGSSKCGDKDGEVVVKQWDNAKDDKTGEIREGDPNTVLLGNNHAVVVAFVPKGERNIPLPPSVAALDGAPAKEAEQGAAPSATGSSTPVPGGQSPAQPVPGGQPPAQRGPDGQLPLQPAPGGQAPAPG